MCVDEFLLISETLVLLAYLLFPFAMALEYLEEQPLALALDAFLAAGSKSKAASSV